MALFLSENDVKQVLTAAMALEAVESAHRDLALGEAQDTPRARTACRRRRCTSCRARCRHRASRLQGVTTNGSGNRFLVRLFDAASGQLLAVIQATTWA